MEGGATTWPKVVRVKNPTQCYVDESIQRDCGFVVSAFVFAGRRVESAVGRVLTSNGMTVGVDEFKSGARMAGNSRMQRVRDGLLRLASLQTHVGVFVGPYRRGTLGLHSLQALQSIVVRNGIRPSRLDVYFDENIFRSPQEAKRLHALFHYLQPARLHPAEDSRKRLGIQLADVVAGSVGQIVKQTVTRKVKEIDIGGPNTGYAPGTMAPLGWDLLMALRSALLTRPMVYQGEEYAAATDPVVLDPQHDDPVNYGQNPTLVGWGVQVAPEAPDDLRHAVERSLGRVWLGCIH